MSKERVRKLTGYFANSCATCTHALVSNIYLTEERVRKLSWPLPSTISRFRFFLASCFDYLTFSFFFRFPKLPEASRSFPKLPEAPRSFPELPEASRSFPKLPAASRSFPKLPEASRSFPKLPEAPRSSPKLLRSPGSSH